MGSHSMPNVEVEGAEGGLGAGGRERSGRRAFLQRLGVAGLALPAVGALGSVAVRAQETTPHPHAAHAAATPAGGYVGSDAGTAGGTGAAAPSPVPQVAPFVRYDPVLPPVQRGFKEITVVSSDQTLYLAKDVPYAAWTFDGTVPGRALRVVEGDTVAMTVRNGASITHSLDTHAARTPPNASYRNLQPGEEMAWGFVAKTPGAYLYHCGTPPILMHIGVGMYGAMIVDPKDGWPPAQELCLVQSDFYLKDDEQGSGAKVADYTKMLGHGAMDYVAFNGHASQYVDEPIPVRVGEPIRIFVVNAGPNVWSSFHVVGAVFDRVCVNANPKNELFGLQSITIGPGDGACVEFTLDEPGTYPAVNHAFGHAAHGAIALLQAT